MDIIPQISEKVKRPEPLSSNNGTETDKSGHKKAVLRDTADMKNFRRFLRSFFKTLAFLCLGLLLSASFLPFRAVKALPAAEESAAIRTVGRGETVEHLFTHCLIAHPEVAFAENNEYGRHLDETA